MGLRIHRANITDEHELVALETKHAYVLERLKTSRENINKLIEDHRHFINECDALIDESEEKASKINLLNSSLTTNMAETYKARQKQGRHLPSNYKLPRR